MNETGDRVFTWLLAFCVFCGAILLILLCVKVARSQGQSQGQIQANVAVANIWGSSGFARKSGRNYQIGCIVSGNSVVVAESQQDYATALLAVNLKTNGAHVVTATIRDDAGSTTDSQPVTVILCNAP